MHGKSGPGPVGPARLSRVGLVVLYLFTGVALLGYVTFGLNPALLGRYPQLVGVYGSAFGFFAQAQIWLAWGVLAIFLYAYSGWRWMGAFTALYGISLGSELLGTRVGIPFGEYHYTAALGPKILGEVPLVIPLSWFFMAIPSYAVARRVAPGRPAVRVLVASLVLLAWDLALDPAMSMATAYWVWGEPGSYYGMPWSNLFGWYVTGIALMAALVALRSDDWIARLPLSWLVWFYGVNLLLPVGMSAAVGLWGAVAATLAALLTVWGIARAVRAGPARAAEREPREVAA